MRLPRNLAMILVGVWLILFGLTQPPIGLSFQYAPHVLGILAIVAGVLVLLGRGQA